MEEPVLHVIVIGFHHKKGCQVEFSYPPLIDGNSVESHEIPEEWKHIPSLALPDGAHNYLKDTVYFLLPGRKDNPTTVYGVSCYRQMDANDLINKTADVTRSTVQKSVCVLSRLPLFGLIKAKLELITHAYFDERDFSQVALLEQTFKNLNSSLTQSLLEGTQVFLGLPARELVSVYKHKIIVLFKLFLLERRVLFFGSPVESLCETVLGLLSLFPGMLEGGLVQACNQWNDKKLSPTLGVADLGLDQDENEQFLEVRYHSTPDSPEGMGHMHNSTLNVVADKVMDYTALDINEEAIAKCVLNADEAPESLSIPREPFAFEKTDPGVNSLENTIKQFKVSDLKKNAKMLLLKSDSLSPHKDSSHSEKSGSRSVGSDDADKLVVHAFHKAKRQSSVDEAKIQFNVNHSCDVSPLVDVAEITHIESVQSGVLASDSVLANEKFKILDGNANAIGSNEHIGLTLHSTKPRPENSEIIEDIDSPESISKIDKEDCFSWEQDRLQLSIEPDLILDDSPGKELSTLATSMTASHDSIISDSGKESVSSDSTTTSASSQDKTPSNILTLENKKNESGSPSLKQKKTKVLRGKLSSAFSKASKKSSVKEQNNETAMKHKGEVVLLQDQFGHPLAIFSKGSVCHPYLSLQYHDILTDVNTRSFVVGATNVLFKQRRQLIDVVVEINDGKVDIRDRELQRHLGLTTADLRFAEYIVKTVTEERPGLFLDGTEWEGSDEWVRAQFRHYLNSLLAVTAADDAKAIEDFGSSFMSAWKTTHNFRFWSQGEHPAIRDVTIGHPFQGNLSMADVRVRFNHTLQNTERGRKINAAVVQTGKYVVQTGKAVGGALSSVRSAMTGWLSSWRQNDKLAEEMQKEPGDETNKSTDREQTE